MPVRFDRNIFILPFSAKYLLQHRIGCICSCYLLCRETGAVKRAEEGMGPLSRAGLSTCCHPILSSPILLGQLDKVCNNFCKPIRILIHQAVACPFELNQPGDVYIFGQNERVLRRRYDILRAGDYEAGDFIEPSRSKLPGQVSMAWAWRSMFSGIDVFPKKVYTLPILLHTTYYGFHLRVDYYRSLTRSNNY